MESESDNDEDEALAISIPREVASYASADEVPEELPPPVLEMGRACLPLNYVPDPGQRVELYRKLASLLDVAGLEQLKQEVRDRFGAYGQEVELLFLTAELKLLAASKRIDSIEVRDNKLMLSRSGDLIQVSGRFPRLSKRQPAAKLREIRRLIQSLS